MSSGFSSLSFNCVAWDMQTVQTVRTVQMLTFVGPALELPQISDPTPEEVGRVRWVFFFLWLTMWKSSEYICIYVLYVSLCAFLRPVLVLIFNKSERIIMIVCVTSKCVAICSCSKQFDSKFQCNKSGLRWMFRNGPLRCRLTNGMPNIQMLLWLSWSLLRGT